MESATLENERAEPELAKEIMMYYLRNPQAADTLEGIARWRLLEQRIYQTVSQVDEAVDWLVSEGLLLKSVRFASPPIFELNRDRMSDCQRYLQRASSEAERGDENPAD